jgi:hypothetical protein
MLDDVRSKKGVSPERNARMNSVAGRLPKLISGTAVAVLVSAWLGCGGTSNVTQTNTNAEVPDAATAPSTDASSSAGRSSSTATTPTSMAHADASLVEPRAAEDAGPDGGQLDAGDQLPTVPRCVSPPALPAGTDCHAYPVGAQCRYGLGNSDTAYGTCTCTAKSGGMVWVCSS